MKYITINEEYLSYLRSKESKIPFQNYGEYKYKPFISPLFEVNGLVYVTHLTHFNREKHENISSANEIKHIVRDVLGNPVSVINLAGMFPVPPEAINELRYDEIEKVRLFRDEIEKYKFTKFLKIQMKSILNLNINECAKNLYARKKVFDDKDFCIDFLKLEDAALEWQQVKTITQKLVFTRTRSR